jgi:Bacteriophage head to tail connecting protein.
MDENQDEALVKRELAELDRNKNERAPYEGMWRDIEERVNPNSAGGFLGQTPGNRRGQSNFDVTAVQSLGRFAAAMRSITLPKREQYIKIRFADKDLDKLPEVRRWCEAAGDRLYAIRYRPGAAFGTAAFEDFRQTGSYGTAPMWNGELRGKGLFYRSLPLHECYIDTDVVGEVDTVRRCFKRSARQLRQLFGEDGLTPKMREAIKNDKAHHEFEVLHVVRPNGDLEPDRLDYRGKPVSSTYIAMEEKWILNRGGFRTMPISVSRHDTASGEKYGRSPASNVLPSIMGANVMAQTILRAGHKAVDPALAFYDDDGITSLSTKPGGLNPGLVDHAGNLLVKAIPQGGDLPVGIELLEGERNVIRTEFLEDFWMLLRQDQAVQRSAQAVLEIAAKQGALVEPYADRFETEKQNPVTLRDLELAMSAGQVDPFPDVVREAGASPMVYYENPLSRMARAGEGAGFTRWIEAMTPMAQVDPGVWDHVDTDTAAPGLADVLGVRPSWIATPDKVAAKRQARADAEMQQQTAEQMAAVAGAYKDMAQGNQIAGGL